ncbi:MAG: cytochrome c, partial [Alphaproteobacteria bacterium]|nr:cytochrome c [Alphaproteobacteria bacterium]
MSISDRCAAWALAAALCVAAPAFAEPGPELGEPVSAEEVAKWDISIAPDGATLPPGQGDATAGERIYAVHCERCHGRGGRGGEGFADALVGGIDSLTSDSPVKTVASYWPYATTMFDYVRRAMPYDRPMSLSNDDVYAVTAYLLSRN